MKTKKDIETSNTKVVELNDKDMKQVSGGISSDNAIRVTTPETPDSSTSPSVIPEAVTPLPSGYGTTCDENTLPPDINPREGL